MNKLYELLAPARQLEVAVCMTSPAGMAQTFAVHAGQFYDREPFDALARRINDLYATRNAEAASAFRSRLDRRLRDRHHEPVVWECETRTASPTAA